MDKFYKLEAKFIRYCSLDLKSKYFNDFINNSSIVKEECFVIRLLPEGCEILLSRYKLVVTFTVP